MAQGVSGVKLSQLGFDKGSKGLEVSVVSIFDEIKIALCGEQCGCLKKIEGLLSGKKIDGILPEETGNQVMEEPCVTEIRGQWDRVLQEERKEEERCANWETEVIAMINEEKNPALKSSYEVELKQMRDAELLRMRNAELAKAHDEKRVSTLTKEERERQERFKLLDQKYNNDYVVLLKQALQKLQGEMIGVRNLSIDDLKRKEQECDEIGGLCLKQLWEGQLQSIRDILRRLIESRLGDGVQMSCGCAMAITGVLFNLMKTIALDDIHPTAGFSAIYSLTSRLNQDSFKTYASVLDCLGCSEVVKGIRDLPMCLGYGSSFKGHSRVSSNASVARGTLRSAQLRVDRDAKLDIDWLNAIIRDVKCNIRRDIEVLAKGERSDLRGGGLLVSSKLTDVSALFLEKCNVVGN